MIILGIDPGTATTGFGSILVKNNSFEALEWGLIETNKESEPSVRLMTIHSQMLEIIKKTQPDVIAIEKLFFAANAKTAIRVGQAQGVMLLAAAHTNSVIFEYAPGTIKKMVTGDGRADKKIVQSHIRKIFGAKVRSGKHKKTHFDNAADALAVALCHAYIVASK